VTADRPSNTTWAAAARNGSSSRNRAGETSGRICPIRRSRTCSSGLVDGEVMLLAPLAGSLRTVTSVFLSGVPPRRSEPARRRGHEKRQRRLPLP
jgi:hypothetical protein